MKEGPMALSSIHPFPARMAPELVSRSLKEVSAGGRVLDPMCGSGTVARAAVEAGLRCVGRDVDPLAVLMARAWTTPVDAEAVPAAAEDLVCEAKALADGEIERPADPETLRFIAYWFASQQEDELARLATVLRRRGQPLRDVLAVALSRIIVSKEMMASLARDTSHSRPHKVADTNDFDVHAGFLRSARLVATRLAPGRIRERADVRLGDARTLDDVEDASINLVLTSPPYLNAIDYLRGHRLALVWLGHEVGSLRAVRAGSVGTERALPAADARVDVARFVLDSGASTLASRHQGWIRRYAADMTAVLRQLARVIKRSGRVVLVLGNSFLRGAAIDNAGLVESLARNVGFETTSRSRREIPARRRYLPPPGAGVGALDARMRTETVLAFAAR